MRPGDGKEGFAEVMTVVGDEGKLELFCIPLLASLHHLSASQPLAEKPEELIRVVRDWFQCRVIEMVVDKGPVICSTLAEEQEFYDLFNINCYVSAIRTRGSLREPAHVGTYIGKSKESPESLETGIVF